MTIAFLYEHPTWSDSLLSAFSNRNMPLVLINVADLKFDTNTSNTSFDVAINRVNMMPSEQRRPEVVSHTLHYLQWLEIAGVRIINGSRAHLVGASKAMQNGIFSSLGLNFPEAIAVYRSQDVVDAATKIGYPVIVKPNIGGSGSGVALYRDEPELKEAVKFKALDLGVDGTGLVQEFVESDGFVYRVEILGDELFYCIKQPINANSFNYCAADGCAAESSTEGLDNETDDLGGIQLFEPDVAIINDVKKIILKSGADVGGVEFFIDTKTNKPCYYDFNPYSNFVSNGESLLGFSPEERYVDFVLSFVD